jgi:uncharacterized protein
MARGIAVDDDPTLLSRVSDPNYPAKTERAICIHLMAWDLNCRQHFPRLLHEQIISKLVNDYEARIAVLQDRVAAQREDLFTDE